MIIFVPNILKALCQIMKRYFVTKRIHGRASHVSNISCVQTFFGFEKRLKIEML